MNATITSKHIGDNGGKSKVHAMPNDSVDGKIAVCGRAVQWLNSGLYGTDHEITCLSCVKVLRAAEAKANTDRFIAESDARLAEDRRERLEYNARVSEGQDSVMSQAPEFTAPECACSKGAPSPEQRPCLHCGGDNSWCPKHYPAPQFRDSEGNDTYVSPTFPLVESTEESVLEIIPGVNALDLGTNSYNRFVCVGMGEDGPYTFGLATVISRAAGMNGTGKTNITATFGDVLRIEGKRYTLTDNRYSATGPRKGDPLLVPVVIAESTEESEPEAAEEWHVYAMDKWRTMSYVGYAPVNILIGETYREIEYRHRAENCNNACVLGSETGPVEVPQGAISSAIVMAHSPNGEPWESDTRSLAPWNDTVYELERIISNAHQNWSIHTLPNGDMVAAWLVGNEIISVFLIERGMQEYRVKADIEIVIPGLSRTLPEYSGIFLCTPDQSVWADDMGLESEIAHRYAESREWSSEAVANIRVKNLRHVPWV